MRNGSGIVGLARAAGVTLLAAGALGAAPPKTPLGPAGKVHVTVSGLRSADGTVRACLTRQPKVFPKCRGGAGAYERAIPAARSVTLVFDGVMPGRYAIALLHDENDNGKADRALLMMPREGFGFSRDAKVRMGPPAFDAAAFDVGAGATRQAIRMRYLL